MRKLLLTIPVLAVATSANAVVWADEIDDATVLAFGNDARFQGVGLVDLHGSFGTGTYLGVGGGKAWMLTARHVLDAGSTAEFVLPGDRRFDVVGRLSFNDVTVAEITSPFDSLAGIFTPRLNLAPIAGGQNVVSAGFGFHCTQSETDGVGGTFDGQRRGFESVELGLTESGTGVIDRFDAMGDPNRRAIEAFGAPGDSGSMLMRESDGAILGVLSVGDDEVYGGFNYYSALRPEYSRAIYDFTGLNPVPEPASMATLALGMVAVLRRRKRG